MTDLFSLRATVYGRVQGVFFRSFVNMQAEQLGLSGYVRNLPDGAVEVRAEGEREPLGKLVGYLNEGPPAARIDRVVTTWSKYTGKFSGFRVRY